MTTETALADHIGSRLAIWESALKNLRTKPGLDDETRRRWVELYEYEVARCKGEGVTVEECARIRARLEAWTMLRRGLPTSTPPEDDGFLLYCAVQHRLGEYRRGGGEKVADAELERAGRFGRAQFYCWYDPIAEEVCAVVRAISKLRKFGTDDDELEIARLQERGNRIIQWLRYQVSSDLVQWLPQFADALKPLDEWWREDVDRKQHRDVIAFWESRP